MKNLVLAISCLVMAAASVASEPVTSERTKAEGKASPEHSAPAQREGSTPQSSERTKAEGKASPEHSAPAQREGSTPQSSERTKAEGKNDKK